MVILSIALALTLGGIAILIAMVVNLRARVRTQDAQIRKLPKPPSDDDTKSGREVAPSLIAEYPDDMEIPAALVGARCKEAIEHFAPILGTTPVNLLRAALAEGLTGGAPGCEGVAQAA